MRISFFNLPEHRVFTYRPRYYDETKEHIQELEKKYATDENGEKIYVPGMSIREAYRKGIDGKRKQAGNARLKNIILLLSMIAVFVVAYYIAQGMSELFTF